MMCNNLFLWDFIYSRLLRNLTLFRMVLDILPVFHFSGVQANLIKLTVGSSFSEQFCGVMVAWVGSDVRWNILSCARRSLICTRIICRRWRISKHYNDDLWLWEEFWPVNVVIFYDIQYTKAPKPNLDTGTTHFKIRNICVELHLHEKIFPQSLHF